ncbi:MAG: HAD-IIB family hydrolase [bacterium]|nr:HAD-IIB family hydrolase [bacterium]
MITHMAVRWIIADVDGCLTPEESIPWDLERFVELARLTRAAAAGRGTLAPVTLCTGRPQPYVEVLMKLLDLRAPCICENGAVFYTLHDNTARYGPGVSEEKILGLRAVRAFIERELLPAHPELVMQFGKEAQMSIYSENPVIFAAAQPRIEAFARANGGPELVINRSHYYLNISLAGINKGRALGQLCDELAVGRAELAGIGDTEGDLPLREAVGFFACPANAVAGIKAMADYVSPYPMLEGVLDILKRPEFKRIE